MTSPHNVEESDWSGFLSHLSEIERQKANNASGDGYGHPDLDGLENISRPILGRGRTSSTTSSTPQEPGKTPFFEEWPQWGCTSLPLYKKKLYSISSEKGQIRPGYNSFPIDTPHDLVLAADYYFPVPFACSLIRPQNMIAQSQSGTGKTATFLIAILSRVRAEEKYCQCLCMAPTRELAMQIVDVGRRLATHMSNITFGVAVRDEQIQLDADGRVTDQIVVGTPGTVMNWVRGTGRIRVDPTRLTMFVLDEADVMMEQEGFLNISKRIKSKLSPACQILLFSATYGDTVMEFARELVPNPLEIRVKRSKLPLKNIKQYYLMFSDWKEKYEALSDLYGDFDVGQAIIFCGTRKEATWLEGRMKLDGHRVVVLSGDLEMLQRQDVIEQFRKSDFRVLITTNVCSRGLDIPQVNLVINWNMPTTRSGSADCETYLHRIGRSGRFGKEGLAVNFITPEDKHIIIELEKHFPSIFLMSLIRSVHHLRFACKDVWQTYRLFANGFGYRFHCLSKHGDAVNLVITNGNSRLILSEMGAVKGSPEPNRFINEMSGRYMKHERPFDVAFEVGNNMHRICERVHRLHGHVLLAPVTHSDYHGKVTMAVVQSCMGDVLHTLLDTSRYRGLFMPGCFLPELGNNTEIARQLRLVPAVKNSLIVSHLDHIAFACEAGQIDSVMQWYQDVFGMHRVTANHSDDESDGFIVSYGDTGMRLKAIEPIKDEGVQRSTLLHEDSSQMACQFVFVEPLEKSNPNQVTRFLEANDGPGIQHVGLAVRRIIESVSSARTAGVSFVDPPPDTYYDALDSPDPSVNLDDLRKFGVLLDAEVERSSASSTVKSNPFLLQVFTKPLFQKDAFFMELIQRHGGATGFGAANIIALWRALEVSMQKSNPTRLNRAPTT